MVAYILVSSVLVFLFLLAVQRWRDKVGHLNAILQEILCANIQFDLDSES